MGSVMVLTFIAETCSQLNMQTSFYGIRRFLDTSKEGIRGWDFASMFQIASLCTSCLMTCFCLAQAVDYLRIVREVIGHVANRYEKLLPQAQQGVQKIRC